jgi:hypothetical protein
MIFFQALFIIVAAELSMELPKRESIQSAWCQHLSAGETPVRVGILRTRIYDRVVLLAKSVENTTLLSATNPLISDL